MATNITSRVGEREKNKKIHRLLITMTKQDEDITEFVEDEEEDQEKPIEIDSGLYAYAADFTLEVLDSKLRSEEIVIPPFQRKYVWNQIAASRLIESFMRTLPIPPIYLFTTPENKLWVVDGHQRLITIKRFFENIWEEDEEFKLVLDDKNELNDKSYQNLSDTEQRKFKNAVLRAVIVEPRTGNSDEALYDMFERLNTGGTLLKPQEIRNCVYHGSLNDTLHKLNKNTDWRKILGTEIEDKRQRDTELILRGITLYHIGQKINGSILEYKPSLKNFLNNFMKVNQNPNKASLNNIEKLFLDTTKSIVGTLGEKPFHLRRAMNAATFDAVFVAYARHLNSIPADIKQRYEKLKSNTSFRGYTEERPTGVKSVNDRIDIAEKILFG